MDVRSNKTASTKSTFWSCKSTRMAEFTKESKLNKIPKYTDMCGCGLEAKHTHARIHLTQKTCSTYTKASKRSYQIVTKHTHMTSTLHKVAIPYYYRETNTTFLILTDFNQMYWKRVRTRHVYTQHRYYQPSTMTAEKKTQTKKPQINLEQVTKRPKNDCQTTKHRMENEENREENK